MSTNAKPKVSIIIPHHNNYSILQECVQSIYKIKYKNKEIIIVNNASTDNSINRIHSKYNDIIIKNSSKNLGYSGGCNLGASIASGEYLLFLNNDTIHESDFLNILVNMLNDNPKIASVQPKIKNYNQRQLFDYAGASGGYMDFLVFPFCRGRIFNTIEKDKSQYNKITKVFWTSGTCFLTRKEIFIKMKGFDEKLFSHMEEIDYCWKCYLSNYECYINPKSTIYHHGGSTLGYQSSFKTYLNHKNSLILLLTNYSLSLSILLFPIRIILEIISSFTELFKFKIFHFIAHYRALLSLFNIVYLIKRRLLINSLRIVSDKSLFNDKIIYKQSIVFKYFLLRKIYFKDL